MRRFGKFFHFFKNLVFLEDYSTDVKKSGTNGSSAHSHVCLHNPQSLFFNLTPLSTAFEKVCGENFWPDFLHLLENYSPKFEILGSTDRTGFEKLTCISGYTQFFLHKVMALRKVKFLIFLAVFRNFLTFLKNYPPKSEILFSIKGMACEKLHCISGYAHFFTQKNNDPRKGRIFDLSPFFETLYFSRKLTSPVCNFQ